MRIFITGGTGFIGGRLTRKLAEEGNEIILLVRDRAKSAFLNGMKNITFIDGDLFSLDKLQEGMKGCSHVFHLAAHTLPWSRDPSLPYKINVTGTRNVIESALKSGVGKMVITSTGGIFGYSKDGNPVDETTDSHDYLGTSYESTKSEVESMASGYAGNGIDITFVNPTRVYGPGKLTKSNPMTMIIKNYLKGSWRIIPGDGTLIGNYVYIDDVVSGHILAAQKGRSGERYILGGENISFNELFALVSKVSGIERQMIRLPFSVIKNVTLISLGFSRAFNIQPPITPEWVEKYSHNWIVSSNKAIHDLGYKITPIDEGISRTVSWLKTSHNE